VWRHKGSPTKKKFKAEKSAGKVMCSIFWDRKRIIFVGFLELGHTINAVRYVETMKTLKSRIARIRSEKKKTFFFSVTTPGPTPPS
jgi:hypothetical protein